MKKLLTRRCKHNNLYPSMKLQMKMMNCGHFLMNGYWECTDCGNWIFIECEEEWNGTEGVVSKDGKREHRRVDRKNKICFVCWRVRVWRRIKKWWKLWRPK